MQSCYLQSYEILLFSEAGAKRAVPEASNEENNERRDSVNNIKEEPADVQANVAPEDGAEFAEDYAGEDGDMFEEDGYDATAADINNMGEDYVEMNESFAAYDDYGDDNNEEGATSKK